MQSGAAGGARAAERQEQVRRRKSEHSRKEYEQEGSKSAAGRHENRGQSARKRQKSINRSS